MNESFDTMPGGAGAAMAVREAGGSVAGRRSGAVRLVAALCAALLAMVALSGCGFGGFSIQGQWESVGDGTWGLVTRKGKVVTFHESTANLFSPRDTYTLTKNSDGSYKLEVTGLLGSGGTFHVTTSGNDHMTLTAGDITLEFKRVG
ncbi:hypothetical protein [Bifidobacterium leontopitheci]|uniref:DUF5640 domain-containing protein n=1 Tax=Bifidobacterium leontopitheci TaxID=2650774 RepID=A0A6I1GPX7_9BIFI|nr:hypothetical protein [Bifidobacterium leontopitheci]KAB7791449.1 hypothetical protein F7D09_0124 [Bifidobacterium leontopitheci]